MWRIVVFGIFTCMLQYGTAYNHRQSPLCDNTTRIVQSCTTQVNKYTLKSIFALLQYVCYWFAVNMNEMLKVPGTGTIHCIGTTGSNHCLQISIYRLILLSFYLRWHWPKIGFIICNLDFLCPINILSNPVLPNVRCK